jgi:hypothetical protein
VAATPLVSVPVPVLCLGLNFVCVEDVYGGRLGGAENTAGAQRQRSRSRQTQNQRYDTGRFLIFCFRCCTLFPLFKAEK